MDIHFLHNAEVPCSCVFKMIFNNNIFSAAGLFNHNTTDAMMTLFFIIPDSPTLTN